MSIFSRLTKTNSTGEVKLQNNYVATVAPTSTDDVDAGYSVGSVWIDVTADERYVCLDSSAGSAVWAKSTAGTAGEVVFTPAGGVASTDVQNAIEELDTEKVSDVAVEIDSASAKVTPVNTDLVGIVDTEASNVLKKLTFTNLKAFLKTYFDTLYIGDILGDTTPQLGGNLDLNEKKVLWETKTVASSATPTPAGDTTDVYTITALGEGATIGAPTGTPTNGQKLILRIKDDGTSRSLAWNAIYRASTDLALPTATTISKTMYLGFVYNSTDSKWDLLAYIDNI